MDSICVARDHSSTSLATAENSVNRIASLLTLIHSILYMLTLIGANISNRNHLNKAGTTITRSSNSGWTNFTASQWVSFMQQLQNPQLYCVF
ncbi:hypothetical protein BC941DRAFT_465491 [Chlamydoabsidia padenii]|nr:hypothetical protein BC941DRAFT_465491 [Chlamydoabsidia padenii]